jgi:hypothetical protein
MVARGAGVLVSSEVFTVPNAARLDSLQIAADAAVASPSVDLASEVDLLENHLWRAIAVCYISHRPVIA